MINTLQLPIDLPQLPQFRKLCEAVETRSAECGVRSAADAKAWAVLVWVLLWQELAYQMQDGVPAGRLPKDAVVGLLSRLEVELLGDREWSGRVLAQLVEPVKLLTRDGDDYFCPRFATMHAGKAAFRSPAEKGGDRKALNRRMASLDQVTMQQALLIQPTKFKDADGAELDAEMAKKATRLIIAIDFALFADERQTFAFTEALIQNAVAVLRQVSGEEIDAAIRLIGNNRKHPVLAGLTTERILPDFKALVRRLPED